MNGSYTARFTLRWTGNHRISVKVMHSSEAVSALRRVSENFPTRASYDGFFWNGNDVTVSACHITPYFYIKEWENKSYVAEMCNFTDPITGAPWYCTKPANFSCSSYGNHSYSMRDNNILDIFLSKDEKEEILKRPSEIASIGDAIARVKTALLFCFLILDSLQTMSTCTSHLLPPCDIKFQPEQNQNIVAGFYHRDNWISLNCDTHIETNTTFLSNCLQNKTMYFLGDSTLRQWFVYLIEKLGELKIDLKLMENASFRIGMDYWKSRALNTSLYYHHHGFPNTIYIASTSDIHYVANMIDSLPSDGQNTIFFISLAAHFTITTSEFFHYRIKTVKHAILRLHERSPDIPVLVKSANTRAPGDILRPNWFHDQLNKFLSEEFVGLPNVLLVDVWNMTIGHHTGWAIHPANIVIENEIKLVMSYLCKP
ncbi:NXPE family member 3-like [Amphiura filiformis]|uniref:NXPE family member 3-like n=1 Tax=Amphiura filiformis TaxID=82378 RepID=UPI003B21CED8